MPADQSLIERFYSAFAARNGAEMAACYAPDVKFSDPVFQDLHGPEAGAMWRMLTERATDLRVELLERSAQGDHGTAHWQAHYTFTETGRPVVIGSPAPNGGMSGSVGCAASRTSSSSAARARAPAVVRAYPRRADAGWAAARSRICRP